MSEERELTSHDIADEQDEGWEDYEEFEDFHLVELPAASRVEPLPALPGQGASRSFMLVTEGLPLPPAGAGYVAERADDPAHVYVMGYVDTFGRVFVTTEVLDMPPARPADVCLVDGVAGGPAAGGAVQIASPDGGMWDVAAFAKGADGCLTFSDSRVELGQAAGPLPPAQAAAVAYLAYYLLPREQGVELFTMDVDDVFDCLRAPDLFEGLERILRAADVAEEHPLLRPPGLLVYLARELRAAGVAGKTADDLAAPSHVDPVAGLTWAIWGDTPTGPAPMTSPTPPATTPEIRLVRTTDYANLFYIAFHGRQVSDEGARLLLEVESLLNRFLLSCETLCDEDVLDHALPQDCSEVDLWVVERMLEAGDGLLSTLLSGDVSPRADMDVRLAFARACEALRLPYRLEYRFRHVTSQGRLVIDVGGPSARLMPRELWDRSRGAWRAATDAERNGWAARYAFHLAILMGMAAFAAGTSVLEATVNVLRSGWSEPGEEACTLSVTFARDTFLDALRAADISVKAADAGAQAAAAHRGEPAPVARTPWYSDDPFSFVKMFPHAFALGGDYALAGVQPLLPTDDERCLPAGCMVSPERDERSLTPAARAMLLCDRVCDLSIYEDAPRRPLAEEVLASLGSDDVSGQLATVRDIHDRTENLLVRAACLRLSDGIAAGTITSASEGQVKAAFSDIYGMQAGLKAAVRLLAKDPLRGVGDMEAIVASADKAGWFADSPTRAYRYFDCYASRAIYAQRCEEEDLAGRELHLAADEYFLAHHRLATLLASSIDRGEDAIAHARRCVDVAPSVAAAYLRLARCYFAQFDYRSEVETLKRMLYVAWNPADVGMALYWMGYAYWMLGEEETGTACYQRSLSFDASLAESVTAELAEFLRKQGRRPGAMMSDAEMDAIFARAGIPIKEVFTNVALLVRCSQAVLDSGSYRLAQNLLGSAAALLHDDAMAPVLESLGE